MSYIQDDRIATTITTTKKNIDQTTDKTGKSSTCGDVIPVIENERERLKVISPNFDFDFLFYHLNTVRFFFDHQKKLL